MAAVKKIFFNIKFGKERQPDPPILPTQHCLRRANAKFRRKETIDSDFSPLSAHDEASTIESIQWSTRRYSFELGASVENFETELHSHSKYLQKKLKKQSPSEVPVSTTPTSKFGLKVNAANTSRLETQSNSVFDLSAQQSKDQVSEGLSAIYGRYGLVVHPNNVNTPSISTTAREAPATPITPSSEIDPLENAKATSESWRSIPSPTASPHASGVSSSSPDLIQPSHSGRVRGALPDIRGHHVTQLSAEDWRRVAEFLSSNQRPFERNPSFDSAPSNASDDQNVLQPLDKGKGRQVPGHDRPIRFRSVPGLYLVEQSPEYPRSEVSDDVYSPCLKHRTLKTEQTTERWVNGLAIEAERQLEVEREEINQIRAAKIENELGRKAQEATEEAERIRAVELGEQLRREVEQAERKVAEAVLSRLRECVACAESKDPLDFPARPPTAACEHKANTCSDCLQFWMASEFETKGCSDIKCPECPEVLEYNNVQAAASRKTFEAYDKLTIRNALGAFDEFAWCLGPNCGSGQINVRNDSYMECASCKYRQCLKHKVAWHKGETCDQFEYRTSGQKARDEEAATEKMIDTISKKCPGKKCGWRIQKTEGCEHMTCKKCKHQFCWQCLASHNLIKQVGNTAHEKTCKFHSKNLDVTYPFNAH